MQAQPSLLLFNCAPVISSAPDTFDSLFVVLGALVSRNRKVKAEPGGDEQLASPLTLGGLRSQSPTGSKDQMKKARILLAFNRASSLAAFRKPLEDEYEIVGTAADYKNLLAKALKSEPDAILGDVELPLWSEADLKRKLKQLIPKTKVLIVSIDNDAGAGEGSQQVRVSGLDVRRTSRARLMEVFHEFLEEQPAKIAEPPSNSTHSFEASHDASHDCSRELTQRQREVLKLLAEGRTMKQTGEILNLTTRTIAFHKYKIMRDFELHNNLELLRLAIREHLVSAD